MQTGLPSNSPHLLGCHGWEEASEEDLLGEETTQQE
jgi:hypothetical protein